MNQTFSKICTGFSLLALFVIQAAAQGDPTDAALVAHEIAVLGFIGGGTPLTADEKQQAAQIVSMALKDNRAGWLKVDQTIQRVLATAREGNVPAINALRESNRYAYVFENPAQTPWVKEFAMEKKIVETHDPVVAMDAAHRRAVTRHMLQFFVPDGRWIAKEFELPPPAGDYLSIVERKLKTDLAALQSSEPKIADGLAHIESNAWYGPAYFDHLSAANHKKIFVDDKSATFHNVQDHVSEQWQLAEAAALMSRFAASQAPRQGGAQATMSEQVLMQQMTQRALTQSMRSMSPGCNVTVGSYSDRAANNCYPH